MSRALEQLPKNLDSVRKTRGALEEWLLVLDNLAAGFEEEAAVAGAFDAQTTEMKDSARWKECSQKSKNVREHIKTLGTASDEDVPASKAKVMDMCSRRRDETTAMVDVVQEATPMFSSADTADSTNNQQAVAQTPAVQQRLAAEAAERERLVGWEGAMDDVHVRAKQWRDTLADFAAAVGQDHSAERMRIPEDPVEYVGRMLSELRDQQDPRPGALQNELRELAQVYQGHVQQLENIHDTGSGSDTAEIAWSFQQFVERKLSEGMAYMRQTTTELHAQWERNSSIAGAGFAAGMRWTLQLQLQQQGAYERLPAPEERLRITEAAEEEEE